MGNLLDLAKRVKNLQEKSVQRNELNEKNEVSPLVANDIALVSNPSHEPPDDPSSGSFDFPQTGGSDSWCPEIESCIDWFQNFEPPSAPFYLGSHIYVIDPAKFIQSLRHEIAIGPKGPRARLGTLRSDLRALKAKFSGGGVNAIPPEN